ncbi:MAG: ABC transporter ATP-binding protein [Treponema sp.]|nr:ABC transporter ATP-binding protein [Treponema sp.]
MLEIKNLYSGYKGADVIRNISLRAGRGEVLCIVGPNGCGKTTLLKSIAHIIPYRGTVTLDSREVSSFSRKNLAKKIALLGQISELYFPYSIYDTVALGRYAHSGGFLKGLSKEDDELITDIIKKLELYDEKDRMINELSGGQLQRVFLARTLVQDPDIILLDEPTNHLDLKHQVELLRYLAAWAKENNKTVIGVLHDLNLVHHFGDTAALMGGGKLIALGKPETVLDGETLREIYGIDIRRFMLESLENWKTTGTCKTGGGKADE